MGEAVHDFAVRYLDEGLKPGLNTKQICIFMTTQLFIEVRQAAKEWIISKGEEFREAEGISFAVKVRELLRGKGLALTLGHRETLFERMSEMRPNDATSKENEDSGTESRGEKEAFPQPEKVQVIGRRPKGITTNSSPTTCAIFAIGWAMVIRRVSTDIVKYADGQVTNPYAAPGICREYIQPEERRRELETQLSSRDRDWGGCSNYSGCIGKTQSSGIAGHRGEAQRN